MTEPSIGLSPECQKQHPLQPHSAPLFTNTVNTARSYVKSKFGGDSISPKAIEVEATVKFFFDGADGKHPARIKEGFI